MYYCIHIALIFLYYKNTKTKHVTLTRKNPLLHATMMTKYLQCTRPDKQIFWAQNCAHFLTNRFKHKFLVLKRTFLIEMVLLSTYTMCFVGEIRKTAIFIESLIVWKQSRLMQVSFLYYCFVCFYIKYISLHELLKFIKAEECQCYKREMKTWYEVKWNCHWRMNISLKQKSKGVFFSSKSGSGQNFSLRRQRIP